MRWILPKEKSTGSLWERVLKTREIEDLVSFISPHEDQIRSSDQLFDTKSAAEKIREAVNLHKKIFIHGDYDVDGVCATSILWDFLYRELEADVIPYIPSRFDEGYGLTETSLNSLKEKGAELIITVDCGIKDLELAKDFQKQGIDFVITDHHTPPEDLNTDLFPIVHPAYPGKNSPFKEISGTTVAWKLCMEIAKQEKIEFDLSKYIDLVAMATVCDIMPLVDENRTIVKLGVEKMKRTQNIGLQALLKTSGIEPYAIETYHLGYVLGPRINAAGRLDSAMDAVRLLTTSNPAQANNLANQLNAQNMERQDMTMSLLDEAELQIKDKLESEKVHFIYGDEWPEGLVGLVAGKLSEKHYKPILVGSLKDGVIVGSARSIKSFNITSALDETSDLLERYGGHAQAAGFTIIKENILEFINKLNSIANEKLTAEDLEQSVRIDVVAELHEIDIETILKVRQLEPFGLGNPQPNIAVIKANLKSRRIFGKNSEHISFVVGNAIGNSIEVIGFGRASEWDQIKIGTEIDIAGNLDINSWNGHDNPQVKLKALRATE